MANCNRQQLNITCGTDVVLHDRLIFDGETFDPNLSVGIAANLVSSLGKRTALDVQVVDDELLISVPWIDGTLPGCYGLEVTGSCNSKKWATYADSLIKYTKATRIGVSEVTVESDSYDITQEVAYCYSNNPVTFAEVTVDDGYGTPSVDVTYEQRVLSMAFHNLKGNGITDIDVDEQVGDEAVNTVTIKTDADQEGTEFHVRNGSRGNGIASSSEQLSDQDGGVNTFTFTDDDGNVHEFHSKNGTKGTIGDSAVYDPSSPDVPDFVMANTTGQSTTKAMTQKAVTENLRPVRRILDDFEWINKSMHIGTPSTLQNKTGMQTSLAYPVKKGDKVVVDTSNNGTNTFTVIAYLTTPDQASGWSQKAACGYTDQERHLFQWVADADGYVRVCGYASDMDAYIMVGNALATQEGLDTEKARIDSLNVRFRGKFDDWVWNTGVLHPSSAEPSLPDSSHLTRGYYRYSDWVTVNKGDTIRVKTYFPNEGTYTIIANSSGRIEGSSSEDIRKTYLNKEYKAIQDNEQIRICVYVGEDADVEWEAAVYFADSPVKKSDIAGLLDGVLPEYWQEYLDDRLEDTEDMLESGDDTFVFVTDVHYGDNAGSSTSVIKHIIDNSSIAKVFCGGDICKTGAGSSTYEKLIVQEVRALEKLAEATKENGKFYPAMGNHDYFEYNSGNKYKYPKEDAIKHMKGLTYPLGTHMADDADGLYYFTDNMEAKVRYIVVDCVHGEGYTLKIGATQAQWLVNTLASTPDDYGIVVIGHIPASPRMSPSAETSQDYLANLRNIIVAAAKKQSGSIQFTDLETTTAATVTYDFTNLDADVLMYLCGHTHVDNQTFNDGVPFVATICDKKGQHPYSPFCEDTSLAVSTKPTHSVMEQAIEVVIVPAAHDIISVLRYGIGFDRYFHVGKQTVSAGSTLNLASLVEKITPDTWHICDCDGVAYADNAWNYSTSKATISSGVVTGVAAGEAMAFAEDENHNKEFFHIVVS